MIKNKSKLLLSGTILNTLFVVYGIISIIFVFMQLVDIMPYEATETMDAQMVQMGFVAMLIQTGSLMLSSFMILNGVLSIVGLVKDNKDFILTSTIITGIIAVLYLIISPTYGVLGCIILLITFILMLIGYIKDNKKTTKRNK